MAARSTLTLEELRLAVAALADRPPETVGDDDDLVAVGLDSIATMKLAAMCCSRGAPVAYGELLERRTLATWWDLVSTRLGTDNLAAPVTIADEDGTPFGLATMQYAYWFGRRQGESLAAPSHFYFEFNGGDIDAARLESAVRRVMQRHPMLRARFLDDGRQVVAPDATWPGLTVRDLRDLSRDQAAELLERVRADESVRRLDVEHGEGLDVQLSQIAPGASRVHVNIDMLVADAASFRIIVAEIATLYLRPDTTLPPLSYTFRQYLSARQAEPPSDADVRYWTERLEALPSPPALPLAPGAARLANIRSVRRELRIDRATWTRLEERAQTASVTLAMVFLTAFAEVVAAWSSSRRFLLNLPLFDRRPLHPEIDQVVGDFTSSILLDVDLAGTVSFAESARGLQRQFRADVAHAGYPGVSVLRDLRRRDPQGGALAPVVFTSSLSMGDLFSDDVRHAFGRLEWMLSQTPQVWLDNQVVEDAGGLLVNWDAVDGVFADGVLDAMFAAYGNVLSWLAAPAQTWDAALPDLVPAPQRTVRARVNATSAPQPSGALHDAVFAWADRAPDRCAVGWGSTDRWTYADLARQARQVGAVLRARGVQPGDAVAVRLPKGPSQIVAVLGALSVGAVYVPVSPDHPPLRQARVIAHAGAHVVIDGALIEAARDASPLSTIVAVPGHALAYIIYTSGSTGEPKGVAMTHGAALNTIAALNARYAVGPSDRTLAVSALDFDLSVYDIFGTLAAGGTVVSLDDTARRDAGQWATRIREWGVTIWNTVPALLDMLLVAAPPGSLASLRIVLLGGDWVGVHLPARLGAHAPACRFVALGGTTETAIHSTACEVSIPDPRWTAVPYGYPLPNVRCRVVDPHGRDCPDWVTGEIWIGGAGLAAGYHRNEAFTSERFVTVDAARWYRTGDVGRYWPDGTLEFLGRADFQVKIRGHRIELGEIEAALEAHPRVRQAVALAYGDTRQRLGAVVVGDAPEHLREHALQRLPGYMVPDPILVLADLPLSGNGKVDRTRLAVDLATAAAQTPHGGQPPRDGIEARLAALWCELLGRTAVRRDDNFFALGGDSLLATRLLARLRDAGLAGGSLRSLVEQPTLAVFAAMLMPAADAVLPMPALAADAAARYEPFPMTSIQRAYWIGRSDAQALGGVGSYWYWEFDGEHVDLPRLEAAWNRLIARHDMLRAVFDEHGMQRVLRSVPLYRIEVITAGDSAHDVLAGMRAAAESRAPFALDTWPLFDVRAVQYGEARCRLAFGFDYIVLDALSIMTIFSELATLYETPEVALPGIGVSFRDYVLRIAAPAAEVEAAERHWSARLEQIAPAPAVPMRIGGSTRPARFVRREMRLSPDAWQRIKDRARECNVTPSTVLAAAYGAVLSAWSGGHDVTLNFTLFDRQDVHPDIRRVAGDFTSLLLVPWRMQPPDRWRDIAQRVQRDVWSGLEHRSVSALWVMRQLARQRGPAAALMPFVFTSTLGAADDVARLSFPFGRYAGGVSQTPQVWLDNQVVEDAGGLLVNWDAVDGVFADGVLDAMFAAYGNVLSWLAAPAQTWDAALPDLVPAPQRTVRARVNATSAPQPSGTLHDAVFAWADRAPDRCAVGWGSTDRWTYADLARQARQVGAVLRARGVQPGDAVAVSLPKGPSQIVAVLGALSVGAVYVPVSPDHPPLRQARVIAHAGAHVVIDGALIEAARDASPLSTIVAVPGHALAYIIYTSGSTGEPKGVAMTHGAALNTIAALNARYAVGPSDRTLAVSALDFDLSVYDIFGTLAAGGTVVSLDDTARRDAGQWATRIREWGVTIWNTVPALLDMLLVAAPPGSLASLRIVLASGDWVALDLPDRLHTHAPQCRFVALGGATEAAIWSNAIDVDIIPAHWSSIPYGYPLPNVRCRVVDPHGRDCPDWVTGEIWIGGAGLAAGYHRNEAFTSERFVTVDAARWYRTGDVGRYWPDGTLEFLGRADFQVKIRGHRIELGEIEAALEAHPRVRQAVALAYGDTRQRLGAVVVGDAPEHLREHALQRLPGYMVPDPILVLADLPLSGNGKVDRTRLAVDLATAAAQTPHGGQPPRDGIEARLAALWRELLGRTAVRRDDNFFALGGDSLLATRLVQNTHDRLGLDLPLQALFSSLTLADLATLLGAQANATEIGVIE